MVTDEAQAALHRALRPATSAGSSSCRSSQAESASKGQIDYLGPVLAGNRLILAGSNGDIDQHRPATGAFQSQTTSARAISLPPVVANSTLYVLDDQGQLSAFR